MMNDNWGPRISQEKRFDCFRQGEKTRMPHVDLTTFGWTIKMSLVLINELLNGSVLHKCQNLIWNVKIILRNVGWGVGGGWCPRHTWDKCLAAVLRWWTRSFSSRMYCIIMLQACNLNASEPSFYPSLLWFCVQSSCFWLKIDWNWGVVSWEGHSACLSYVAEGFILSLFLSFFNKLHFFSFTF